MVFKSTVFFLSLTHAKVLAIVLSAWKPLLPDICFALPLTTLGFCLLQTWLKHHPVRIHSTQHRPAVPPPSPLSAPEVTFLHLLSIHCLLSHLECRPLKGWLCLYLSHPQHLEQCLTHSQCSINSCGLSDEKRREVTSLLKAISLATLANLRFASRNKPLWKMQMFPEKVKPHPYCNKIN